MDQVFREVLGYLNFSGGAPDAGFQRHLNELARNDCRRADELYEKLSQSLAELSQSEATFRESDQATRVIDLTLRGLLTRYREHHSDLLFHLEDDAFEQPFLFARMFEAILSQGGPWEETERILSGSLDQLNDFLGYRPIAVLENGRKMQPYDHEQYRPVPLFIRGAGVASGKYDELIQSTLDFLGQIPDDLTAGAWFHLTNLDELAVDVRAHDHVHPVNKRTNYMFGEWDPHRIDTKGFYRRFVLRQIILDALLEWLETHEDLPEEERLFDASAVLTGTILMASSISGSGPETFDSNVSLASLLPQVARQRDAFYARLMDNASGARLKRLSDAAAETRQPFGHVRQQLNMFVAGYGARQVQYRHLAWLYARMGYDEASEDTAAIIPAASARFETAAQSRITGVRRLLTNGDLAAADEMLAEIEGLLERGTACGAFVDPWNVLAFHGQFPLFQSREDAIPDNRVEVLLDLVEQLFGAFSQAVGEAAAQGDQQRQSDLSNRFYRLAEMWDRYATTAVEDVPKVMGVETWESARQVAKALSDWSRAGSSAGDIAFWRERVDDFQSARAYALVVSALLQRHDHVAAMGLMMQWLSEAGTIPLESGPHSIHELLVEWMNLVVGEESDVEEPWPVVKRLFDFVEANAGDYWNAPTLAEFTVLLGSNQSDLPPKPEDGDADAIDPFLEDRDENADDIFSAAYDDVVFRDSADDGQTGETMDSGFTPGTTEFELINREIEPRLLFLQTLFQLWQLAAVTLLKESSKTELDGPDRDVLASWASRTAVLQQGLVGLLKEVWDHEIAGGTGDVDLNIEYDIQLQSRYLLLHRVITTSVSCAQAQRLLGCLAGDAGANTATEAKVAKVYEAVVKRDRRSLRRQLPQLLDSISDRPLLYVPFENGGQPSRVVKAKSLQSLIRFLLTQLPRMGMLRETLDVLRAAFRMERSSRPAGFAVTEFDRLFRIALENSLECLIASWTRSKSRSREPKDLAELTAELVEHYAHLWTLHSNTMRLSTVEELRDQELADEVREFIKKYGGDLFHTQMLTLGNVRTILHQGLEAFLDFLEVEADPLQPVKLIEDLERGVIDAQDAMDYLELAYEAVIDRFDRFLEYNTTTTQSDYGEKFYCFLDFLLVECLYDRDAWTLTPMRIAHEVLVRCGQLEAATMWEQDMQSNTAEMSEAHMEALKELELKHGMRLPALRDRIAERFVKPLVVNRMLALVPQAIDDARNDRLPSAAFESLGEEVQQYLEETFGSGIDIPQWLQNLETEVNRTESPKSEWLRRDDFVVQLDPLSTRFSDISRQLEQLAEPESEDRDRQRQRRQRRGNKKEK